MVTIQEQCTVFRFYRPGVREVLIAGDFNDWNAARTPMTSVGNGYWSAELDLPAGEYRFRYCADGEWFTDYAAFGVEPGEYGLDSLVRVPQRSVSLVAKAPAKNVAASPVNSFAAA
ncbi:MAG: isoamylase early set domain-containing protein [Phycisphaerae bacterium]